MLHELKLNEIYVTSIIMGDKTFEIRLNDRNFKVCDLIHFTPVDEKGIEVRDIYHIKDNKYVITYIFNGGAYGLDRDYCVFSFKQALE